MGYKSNGMVHQTKESKLDYDELENSLKIKRTFGSFFLWEKKSSPNRIQDEEPPSRIMAA
jgi:hypothetical protein